ncbi:MAG: penicillin-binding protein [Patescibacteria group bacterium]
MKKRVTGWLLRRDSWKQLILLAVIVLLFISGGIFLWVATLKIPDLESFQDKILSGSTRLYDKTGEIVLYDLNKDVRQQVVPYENISPYIKNATIAIEDSEFYVHKGVRPMAFLRAVIVNLQSGEFKQGGSTITQQVIKNALLTSDKRISRKIKEWVLALKLERIMTKDQILNLYLNGSPYGGNAYGVEEASKRFFNKSAKDLTLAESAYLAAIPQAPSTYSPFGKHVDKLETRKNVVLQRMKELNFISEAEYETARAEKVTFTKQDINSIKAPHFSMFIKEYLIEKYGEDVVNTGGLKVITTLDYKLQEKAEAIVKENALKNTKNFNATNAGMIAIDPATGQLLVMVGSRDYFDKEIDGNFNITTAHRQPGSSFKPFAYVTAFTKGYTPETVLFDVPTQFSTNCDAYGNPTSPGIQKDSCYMPNNYDLNFRGPMSLRNALAQSINIPAIKTLYLAGMKDTLQTARDLGITSLSNVNQYGLTLVLGGGEASPLEMTGAYGVFANNGMRNPTTGILKITDREGKVLEEFKADPKQVVPEQSVLLLNDVLSDNVARLPLNGPGSATDFGSRQVALKTGTTNDTRDTWIIGYTPQIAVGAWAGNNDNSVMIRKTSGLIIAPMWRQFMNEALKDLPEVAFKEPEPIDPNLKPILRGSWQGGQTYTVDRTTGLPATDATPPENREERSSGGEVHTILHYVDKNNPTGNPPANPASDSQYYLWETPVRNWAEKNGAASPNPQQNQQQPQNGAPLVIITSPTANASFNKSDRMNAAISTQSQTPLKRAEFYINGTYVGVKNSAPFNLDIDLSLSPASQGSNNQLKVVVFDQNEVKNETTLQFSIK